jgi:CheY-like chemotaxis protein
VNDTGVGMTAEQINMLFEEYSRSTEDTEFGMSITKRLVDMIKGEIFVESEPDKGSIFTVRLPQGVTDSGVFGKEFAENLQKFRTGSKMQIAREYMSYGSVLIVDDVETNLYVAKGLMLPYGLHIEVAISGFEAIEKIKEGKVYDIIFVDHTMPVMDGIETVKIIRNLGYSRPIIALTANAIADQSDIFLKNGFDDFVSKPIDTRLLDAVLNKYIRDRQPLEILGEIYNKKNNEAEAALSDQEDKIYSVFIRDAKKALAALVELEDIFKKQSVPEEGDIQKYIVNVHAMKSALTNIRKFKLSDFALKLERMAHKRDFAMIKEQTPKFLYDLRILTEKIEPKKDNVQDGVDEDMDFLRRKLIAIRTTCESYNKRGAKNALMELKQKNWSAATRKLLESISECLLYGDFDKAVDKVEKYLTVE